MISACLALAGDRIARAARLLLPVAALLALAAPVAAQTNAGERARVEARRDGEAIVLSSRVRLHATREQAWAVLTDYERYPDFVPDLKLSRILARDGPILVLEQEGEAGFVFFHYPVRVRLEVVEQPGERVTARAVQGNFRQMDGVYELADADGTLTFLYRGRLVPDFRLPPLVGLPAVRNATERQLDGLVREIHRRAAQARQP